MDLNLVNVVGLIAVWTLLSIPVGMVSGKVLRGISEVYEENKLHLGERK